MKMRILCGILFLLAGAVPTASLARTVTAGTRVANPGAFVSVPLTVDDLSDVGAASFMVNYDATVATCLGIEAGEAVEPTRLVVSNAAEGHAFLLASSFCQPSGTVAVLRFYVREGTAGLFSDVTVANASFSSKDAVTDLSTSNPVTVVNGMVRSLATDAAVARLEAAFRVAPQTSLATLTLADGDGLVADADGEPIRVSGAVAATGAIPVDAPLGGWQTGAYALLSTPTKNLTFALAEASNATIRVETANGLTTYYADVTVDGGVEIVAESGTLSAATRAQVKALLANELAANPGVTSVTVKGDAALATIAADLGIAPRFDVLGTAATATYATPTLEIIAFEPQTGRVRMKVTPGEGNAIRASLATGCVHVYGTKDLSQKMRYISGTAFDLTPYLKDATRGEADLTVALGSHTFIKVKVETTNKQEGEEE